LTDSQQFSTQIKNSAKEIGLPLKELFWFLRLAMMGKTNGPGIHELVEMLGYKQAFKRIDEALHLLS
jgi:glutamyl/glutaminyl-tRNA synthetase